MPPDSASITPLPATARSAVSNGSRVLPPSVDGRSERARRLRDLIDAHISDMGGDDANLSEAQRSLARRCAMLEIQLEALETRFAIEGELRPADLDLYGRLVGHLRRCLETIGLERAQRNVTPDPLAYAASKAKAA